MIGSLSIRHPYDLGEIPAELIVGFEVMPLDPQWVWVIEHENRIVALVITHNMNGILLLLRMNATSSAPREWAVVALRQVLTEAKERGLMGFLTLLQDSKPQEVKLMRIAQRNGAVLLPFSGALAFGSLEVKY